MTKLMRALRLWEIRRHYRLPAFLCLVQGARSRFRYRPVADSARCGSLRHVRALLSSYTWQQIHAFSEPLTLATGRGNLQPRYNIAPTTNVDIIVPGEAGRELISARWWLVPAWWKKSLKEVPSTFNARVETVDSSAMFRDAFKRRRCIVPASGFFEWTGPKTARIPHYFSSADGGLLGIAGLWDRWRSPEGEVITSCTMVVRDADEWTARYHDRMPSFLLPEQFDAWMSGEAGKDILRQTPPQLQEWIVSARVNKTGEGDDDPKTLAKVGPA